MKRSSYLYATSIALGLVLGAMAALESCVLPEFQVGSPPPDADAGVSDATVVKETGTISICGATYPDPPVGDDSGIEGTYVLALRSIDLGENTDKPPGYDLDGQCTCVNEAGPTCVGTKQQCDAPNGIDNTMASLMKLVSLAAGTGSFGSSYFSAKANDGHWSALIEVKRYNGLKDDPNVDVALYVSPGFGATDAGPPTWAGDDAWPVSAASLDADSGAPLYRSKGAYVSNNVLVAALPTAALAISGGTERITINITGGVLTGELQNAGGVLRITNGILAGRWREEDVFKALSSYRDSDGKPFCTDFAIFYSNAKGAVCGNRDILADGTGAKSLPCDSLSLGLGYTAEPAKLGDVVQPAAPSPGCPPNTDPASDACPIAPMP